MVHKATYVNRYAHQKGQGPSLNRIHRLGADPTLGRGPHALLLLLWDEDVTSDFDQRTPYNGTRECYGIVGPRLYVITYRGSIRAIVHG